MRRYWTFHWQNRSWDTDINEEGKRLRGSGSNRFTTRGVSAGDLVFVITLIDGRLYLGGRLTVDRIVSRNEAVRILGNRGLYPAREWVIGDAKAGTPLQLRRRLSPSLTRRLRFLSPNGAIRELCFVSDDRLDSQATRGLQELTEESALLLERILQVTDRAGILEQVLTVPEEFEAEPGAPVGETTGNPVEPDGGGSRPPEPMPDEPPVGQAEPTRIPKNGTAYSRAAEIQAWVLGVANGVCEACGSRAPFTGADGEPFLEVHHVRPLGLGGSDRISNAVALCPNCHRRCHHGIDQVSFTESLFTRVVRLSRE